MSFALIWALAVGGVLVVLVALGIWHPTSGAKVLDWKPTRSYEDEIELELEDIDQMLEAQNERRRRSGRPELSEDDFRAQVDAAQREQKERSESYRERGAESHGERPGG
ncbi:MAG TPA: hypothetical protein VFL87_08075 [Thermoleophilaceae bacterium]|nr:hypothetical protein [Thermoleophilaceae bacterium]